jgi:hypothetical protein
MLARGRGEARPLAGLLLISPVRGGRDGRRRIRTDDRAVGPAEVVPVDDPAPAGAALAGRHEAAHLQGAGQERSAVRAGADVAAVGDEERRLPRAGGYARGPACGVEDDVVVRKRIRRGGVVERAPSPGPRCPGSRPRSQRRSAARGRSRPSRAAPRTRPGDRTVSSSAACGPRMLPRRPVEARRARRARGPGSCSTMRRSAPGSGGRGGPASASAQCRRGTSRRGW